MVGPGILNNLNKRYYSIGEIAEMFDVSPSLIRYWDKEFTILRPSKNRKGDRRFTPANIKQFYRIYDLVKIRGFTLEGAKREIRRKKSRSNQREDLMEKLELILKKIDHLKNEVSHLQQT